MLTDKFVAAVEVLKCFNNRGFSTTLIYILLLLVVFDVVVVVGIIVILRLVCCQCTVHAVVAHTP